MRFIALLILGFLVFFAVYWEEAQEIDFSQVTTGDAHHVGEILQKKGETILLEEQYSHYNRPLSPIWITINDETELLTAEEEEMTFRKLKKGDMVEVWNDGKILESYPGKTTALKLKKLR